jgi:tetratricopeptide (TPR) repeat protein
VADFGLARAVDRTDASRSGEVVGTLRYMAPEQLHGAADARSDIYALGSTLYELLTLRPALDDEARRRSLRGGEAPPEPVRPRKIDPSIPRDLETIVLKCLAPEPSGRYQTAAALAADLRRFVEDRPIHARRASPAERAWRWCRRNPALAVTSALAAMLLVAVAAAVLAGSIQTRRAYAQTRRALSRAEETSQLALDVLDGIYLQLSPDRVGVSSDSDPGGGACACVGLRSGEGSVLGAQPAAMHVQASPETAALLAGLLTFYDRLAEQAGDDSQVMLQSAVAGRRVGDIRQRLGQIDQAEREYAKAVEKLTALRAEPDAYAETCTELARCHNEIGNVRSARLQHRGAYEAHREALSVLRTNIGTGALPDAYRYELARTLYFLSNEDAGRPEAGRARHRKSAIRILEELTRENPDAPDYRFLLALCYRPSALPPDPARAAESARDRERAIRILEELAAEHPEVADYRYELIATYAWIHVSLFPWQGRSVFGLEAEPSLRKALAESQWLVDHNPTTALYAQSRALILAKLGSLCWRTGRLAEAEDLFGEALRTQESVVARFPELPSHHRVLLEFLRLRLGQVCRDRSVHARDPEALDRSRSLLRTCVENLTELAGRPDLSDDRLARSSLPVAREALGRAVAGLDGSDEGG